MSRDIAKLALSKKLSSGKKRMPVPVLRFSALASNSEIFHLVAILKRHAVDVAVAADRNIHALRERSLPIRQRHASCR